MVGLGTVGRLWLFINSYMFLLMLCDKYTIVEKFRVNLVGKMNVEFWGLFLMPVKKVK